MSADAARTPFIGRRRELAALRRALVTTRILTLVGAGGIGKTRLARELIRARRAETTVWIDLAAMRDPAAVAPAIERALGLRGDGTLAADAIRDEFAERRMRIVLDNCEHLLETCGRAATTLVAAAPGARILATSRHALEVPEERVYRVPPMALPRPGWRERTDATELFIACARAVRPTLGLSDHDLGNIGWICDRLAGTPLAMELASARLRHMSLAELRARLAVLPPMRGTDGDPRHISVDAAVDWSYGLLDRSQRSAFRRLSVFATDFTLQAAEAVVGDEAGTAGTTVLDLVDHSLLEYDPQLDRYRMLEPVRQLAAVRLGEGVEQTLALSRTAAYFLKRDVFEREPDRSAAHADAQMKRDFHNVAAVLPWLIAHEPQSAIRILERYVAARWTAVPVHLTAVSDWLRRAIDAYPARDAFRSGGLLALANLEIDIPSGAPAPDISPVAEEALLVALEIKDKHLEGRARNTRATAAIRAGRLDRALAFYDEALPELTPRGRAFALSVRAVVKQQLGDERGAVEDIAAAFAEWDRQLGHSSSERSLTHFCAADIAYRRGELALAESHLRDAIAIRRSADEGQEAGPFELLAHLAFARGDLNRSLHLAGFAEQLRAVTGLWPAAFLALADRSWLATARRAAGPQAARLIEEGRQWTVTRAIAVALDEHDPRDLSARERSVATLVAHGFTDKEIAARLSISARTAENHVQRIRDKLGLRSRAQIGHWIAEHQKL